METEEEGLGGRLAFFDVFAAESKVFLSFGLEILELDDSSDGVESSSDEFVVQRTFVLDGFPEKLQSVIIILGCLLGCFAEVLRVRTNNRVYRNL